MYQALDIFHGAQTSDNKHFEMFYVFQIIIRQCDCLRLACILICPKKCRTQILTTKICLVKTNLVVNNKKCMFAHPSLHKPHHDSMLISRKFYVSMNPFWDFVQANLLNTYLTRWNLMLQASSTIDHTA